MTAERDIEMGSSAIGSAAYVLLGILAVGLFALCSFAAGFAVSKQLEADDSHRELVATDIWIRHKTLRGKGATTGSHIR